MSKDPETGKSAQSAAEEAWDEVSEAAGIDDYGDPIEVDDDEPALKAEDADPEEVEEEAPEVTAEAAPEEEVTGEEVETEEPLEAQIAPHTWSDEWKQKFEAMPPEGKGVMLEMNGFMNKAFNDKMTEVAHMKREQEGVRNAVLPHMEWLQLSGITPETAIQRALGWEKVIQAEGAQGLIKFAQARGIDLNGAMQAQSQEQQYMTPGERQAEEKYNRLSEQFNQVQQYIQSQEQQQQHYSLEQRKAWAENELTTFMNAKDDTGNPIHPYFEQVAPRMTELVSQNRLGLVQAYHLAISETPEIQSALDSKRKADRIKADKARLDKVRKASSTIVSKSTAKASKPPMNVEQNVAAAYVQMKNA